MDKVKISKVNILLLIFVSLLISGPYIATAMIDFFEGTFQGEFIRSGSGLNVLWLIIGQYGFILVPVIVFAKINKLNFKRVFRLNPVSIPTIVLTVVIAVVGWMLSQYATIILTHLYSIIFNIPSEKLFEGLKDFGVEKIIPENAFLGFFLIALTPAICEEALFRGVVLKAYENRGTIRAIFISAILFSIIHFSIIRTIGPLIIGIIAGYLVVKSNSIIPGAIAHFTFNGLSLSLFYLKDMLPEGEANFPDFQQYLALMSSAIFYIAIIALCIWVFKYFNSSRKEINSRNIIHRFFYNIVFLGSPKVKASFNKAIATVYNDFISIISHWPIIIILIIFLIYNYNEVSFFKDIPTR